MRIGKASEYLDSLNGDTIKNWIDRDELNKFFSPAARGKSSAQRDITDDDLLILNTIRALRLDGTRDWVEIAARLDSGYRAEKFPENAAFVNGRAPIQLYQQSAISTREADTARAENARLHAEIAELYEKRVQDVKEYADKRVEDAIRVAAQYDARIARLTDQLIDAERRASARPPSSEG